MFCKFTENIQFIIAFMQNVSLTHKKAFKIKLFKICYKEIRISKILFNIIQLT